MTTPSSLNQRWQRLLFDIQSIVDFGRLLLASGSNGSIQINSGGAFSSNANFTYTTGTNTLNVGNVTGSALAMTIKPLTPSVSQDAGDLTLQCNAATGAGKNGGSVILQSSVGGAGGIIGSVTLKTTAGTGLQITTDGSNPKVALFGATPVGRLTTTASSATFTSNLSTDAAYKESTYGGYTVGQIVTALKAVGILTT